VKIINRVLAMRFILTFEKNGSCQQAEKSSCPLEHLTDDRNIIKDDLRMVIKTAPVTIQENDR
jgi:hypothetical protein